MVRGFSGPPDSHLVHREPLRVDDLDRQVIGGMKGFEFGTEEEIERKLVAVLESEAYIRTVAAWDRKRGRNGDRWGESFSNSSLAVSFDGSSSNIHKDGLTPSKKSKRFSGFDFYRRKLFSPGSSPPTTPSHSLPNSQSHLSIADASREPMDPTRGFHPLISMYYLAREKLERERVYGPGHFASSQISIQSGAVPGVTAVDEGIPNAYGAKAQSQLAKREPQSLVTPVSARADYSMPLPRLPAPETSHYSGMSYDAASATASPTAATFHGQPRARDVGLPPSPQPTTKRVDVSAIPTTPTTGTALPRAPPASTHRRSHSLSQRPTVLRGLGVFGGTEKPVEELAEDMPMPHTAGPEVGHFAAAKERIVGEDERGVHDGPLATGATLVKRFGTLLGGGGRGEDGKRGQGSIGKRTTIVGGVPLKAATDTEAEKRSHAVDIFHAKNGAESEGRRQSTFSPPPLSTSQSQPLSHTHRRAATILDPQGRAIRHERRSSTGGTLLPSLGSIGRHRRPSTGYGMSSGRPVAVSQFGRTEEVEENAEHETSDSRDESFRDAPHVDKDFKPVHLKGLFRYVIIFFMVGNAETACFTASPRRRRNHLRFSRRTSRRFSIACRSNTAKPRVDSNAFTYRP